MDFTAGYRIALTHTHTHTAAACACWEEQTAKAVPKRLCSTTRLRVPLNSMTHFSQLGLAGWQGALVHAALNNWDCKVNVRRIAKDRSNPPPCQPARQHAWFSQLAAHQQISHQHCPRVSAGHAVLENLN